jgi:SAM-dependent methyltransferase
VARDLYEPPPPRRVAPVSRRAFLGFSRARADVDYEGVTERLRAAWAQDGLEPLLRAIEPADRVLAELAALSPGARVLELPPTAWAQLDLQALPYADGGFDAVLSSFGAALAPRPKRVARELARVVRPGGVVGLTAWAPKGLPGRLDELLERPEGVPAPSDWGRHEVATRRLDPLLEGLELRTRTVQLGFESPDALFRALLRPHDLGSAHRPALDRLLASCNNHTGGGVEIDARYLVAVGRRRP